MNSMKYSFLSQKKFSYKKYSLIPLRKQDIQKIKNWRNEQINVLRQNVKLTTNAQLNYYENVIQKSFYAKKPKVILFSFLFDQVCIGYGGFVHLNWNSKIGEISFVNDVKRTKPKTVYQKDLSVFLKLIFKIAFDDLKLNKITTETYDIRTWVIEILENLGFKREGILKNHVLIHNKLHSSILHSKFPNN